MTVIHICNVADATTTVPVTRNWQFRNHYALPWEREYGSYLEPGTYAAHVKLWKAAGMTKSRTRPIEAVVQCHQLFQHTGYMKMRDGPPLAIVTGTEVWTRIELEQYLRSPFYEVKLWYEAARLAARMADLIEKGASKRL